MVSLITISAAIIETEEMALVSAISGVWSSLVTCRMSSRPRAVEREGRSADSGLCQN